MAVLVSGGQGVEKNSDGSFIDLFAWTHEHFFVILEGDVGDHLDVFGTTFKLDSKRLDLLDAQIDVPNGLVKGDHSLSTIFRGIFLKLIGFTLKLGDLSLKLFFVEDFISDEVTPEFSSVS